MLITEKNNVAMSHECRMIVYFIWTVPPYIKRSLFQHHSSLTPVLIISMQSCYPARLLVFNSHRQWMVFDAVILLLLLLPQLRLVEDVALLRRQMWIEEDVMGLSVHV